MPVPLPGPPPLFPAPPLALTLSLGLDDPPPQAATASAPTTMSTALERSPIDMLYLQPRKVHTQVNIVSLLADAGLAVCLEGFRVGLL